MPLTLLDRPVQPAEDWPADRIDELRIWVRASMEPFAG